MNNISSTHCEIAEKLHDIEQRLRQKSHQARNEFSQLAYAQAALEIAREGIAHYRQCAVCKVLEAGVAA